MDDGYELDHKGAIDKSQQAPERGDERPIATKQQSTSKSPRGGINYQV